MPKIYFLLNNHVKFYFEIEYRCLENKLISVALEPKEGQILKYILENNINSMISSEQILDDNWDYWNNKKVLQKVLSTLRKKLALVGISDNCFIAIGADYKVKINAELKHTTSFVAIKKFTFFNNKNIKWIFIPLLLIGLYQFSLILNPANKIIELTKITPVSPEIGMHIEPNFSPRDNSLAFSQKNSDTPNESNIVLMDSNTNELKALTKHHFDQAPSWSPSGDKLAFQRYESNNCEIRLIRLDKKNNKTGPSEKVASCNEHNDLTSITWESENSLFFTDKESKQSPYNIFKLNIYSKYISPYFMIQPEEYKGIGHYFILYNSELSSLYSLESSDKKYSIVNKIGADNNIEVIKAFKHKLMSFGFIDNGVIFKGENNQLERFLLSNTEHSFVILNTPAVPIAHPVVNFTREKLAFVSGGVFKNGILSYDLKSGELAEVIEPEVRMIKPQKNASELLYVSNKTGINQIYSNSKNKSTQLTNFITNKAINHFSASNDSKWLAISFEETTTLYLRKGSDLVSIKEFPNLRYASFSLSNDKIVLSSHNVGENPQKKRKALLIEFSLIDFLETGLTIENSLFGVYHKDGIVYVSPSGALGLFGINGKDLIVNIEDKTIPFTPNLLAVTNEHIFVSSSTRTIKINIENRKITTLPVNLHGEITSEGNSLYFKTRQYGNMVIYSGNILDY